MTHDPNRDNHLLVHVHMPKAGGTSLDSVLKAVYGERLLIAHPGVGWPQKWSEDFIEMVDKRRFYYDAFSGHVTYGIHDLFKRPGLYISTVRDPIERFESYYNFVKHWEIHHHHEAAKGMAISEFLRFLENRNDIELYNLQCLLLCGEKDYEKAAETVYTKYFAILPVRYFSDCVRHLGRKLGWPVVQVPHLNATEHQSKIDELSPRERSALIEGNR